MDRVPKQKFRSRIAGRLLSSRLDSFDTRLWKEASAVGGGRQSARCFSIREIFDGQLVRRHLPFRMRDELGMVVVSRLSSDQQVFLWASGGKAEAEFGK